MSGKEFKQILDTICSGGTTEPNWGGIMEIVEMLKRKEYPPKKASSEVRKKLLESKESVVLNAMFVVEAVVKNTPSSIHREFLSQELLTSMKALVENQDSGMSRAIDKILEVLGEWKAAFGEDSAYKGVSNVFSELERGGYYIPEATIASASYIKKGPDFQESDNCYLCDKKFSKFGNRRHHCRNCGKSICRSCEGEKPIDLPHFDFDSPQIVCITCYKKLEKPESSDSPDGSRPGPSPQPPPSQSNNEELHLQEEEDLQMAIAISLNEQENKKKKTSSSKPVSEPVAPPTFTTAPPTTIPSAPPSSLYGPIYADLDFVSSVSYFLSSLFSLWDIERGNHLCTHSNHTGTSRATAVEFINPHDVSFLLTGTDDGCIRVWRNYLEEDEGSPKLVTSWRALSDMQQSSRNVGMVMEWEQPTGLLYATGDVKYIRVWDTHKELKISDIPTGAESCVSSLALDHCDKSLMVAGCGDGTIRLYDRRHPSSSSLVQVLKEHSSWILKVHIQQPVNNIISMGAQGDVRVWDPRFTRSTHNFNAMSGSNVCTIHHSVPLLACASNQAIKLYNIQNKELINSIRYHDGFMGQKIGPTKSITFHPYKLWMAAGGSDGLISIYSSERKK